MSEEQIVQPDSYQNPSLMQEEREVDDSPYAMESAHTRRRKPLPGIFDPLVFYGGIGFFVVGLLLVFCGYAATGATPSLIEFAILVLGPIAVASLRLAPPAAEHTNLYRTASMFLTVLCAIWCFFSFCAFATKSADGGAKIACIASGFFFAFLGEGALFVPAFLN